MTQRLIYLRMMFATLIASLAASSSAWTINARELVDVQFAADDSLIILVSAPKAIEPGIYRWHHDAPEPILLCRLASPTSFSFDRNTIIERVAGLTSEVRLYSPSTCELLDRIRVDGRVMDVDVQGNHVAVALRFFGAPSELRLYEARAKREKNDTPVARAVIGRNVEMGFAPDGRGIVNFDLSDGGAAAWQVPTLASFRLPLWTTQGETTFVPGSTFVKRYAKDTLTVARWPSGNSVYTTVAARTVRIRQLSVSGRFGMLHGFDSYVPHDQSLDWFDFATQKRVSLATGSIDNAAINASGNRVAWVLRSSDQANSVSVQSAQINADGTAIATHGAK